MDRRAVASIGQSDSYDASSSPESTDPSGPAPYSEPEPVLAKKESRAVNQTKGLVYIVILVCALAFGYWSHDHLKRQDMEKFRATYHGFANELLEGSERNALQAFSRLHSISQAITSEAKAWPEASLPNFDKRTTPFVVSDTDPELYLFAPMVTNVTKRSWEDYAWEHQGWIKDDLNLRGLGDSVDPGEIPRRIHPFFEDDEYDLDEIDKYGEFL
jgi:hypothetical protein